MPLVSIIMGVYNCKSKKKLQKSVQSIINQTFTDWEFIICDDGSTDNTLQILKEIEKMDSRIKVYHYDNNVSLGNALNVCISHSDSKFIARQDDDDISLPNRLEKEFDFMQKHTDYSMVGTCASIFDENGLWGHYGVPKKPNKKSFLKNIRM